MQMGAVKKLQRSGRTKNTRNNIDAYASPALRLALHLANLSRLFKNLTMLSMEYTDAQCNDELGGIKAAINGELMGSACG